MYKINCSIITHLSLFLLKISDKIKRLTSSFFDKKPEG